MPTYSNATEMQDASYGLYSSIDNGDKNLILNEIHRKVLAYAKPTVDAGLLTLTTDIPVLYADFAMQVLQVQFTGNASIPGHAANYATFSAKRYTNGVPAVVPVMAQRSTTLAADGGALTAYIPYVLNFFSTETKLLAQGEELVLDINKAGAGQTVGAGVWEVYYRYI